MVQRAYRYRFYPTSEQASVLSRTFGCVRLVYNRALDVRTVAWHADQRRLTSWTLSEEVAFLNEVAAVPHQQSLRHLERAFEAFWAGRARYPRFKAKRRQRDAAEYTRSAFRFQDGQLTLVRLAGPLHIRWSRPLPEGCRPSTVTVSRDPVGRWYVSLRVARLHPRIADRRRDHLHKLTTRLVRENQTIVIEDLHVRGMLGNHSLARAIGDAAWSELRRMLQYKCAWYGRDLVVVNRWLPSSKTCSTCGHLTDQLALSVRNWPCQRCGSWHDRDVNAAKNILAAGRAVAACGAGVRPQRESSRTGRPAVKQEAQRAT